MTKYSQTLKIDLILNNWLLPAIMAGKKTVDIIDKLPKIEFSRKFLIWQV
jgi:hypothetical protein